MPPTNWESLYVQLGRLVEATPMLNAAQITPEVRSWLGRAGALIEEIGDAADVAGIRIATAGLYDIRIRHKCAHEILSILYRSLETARLRSPAALQGAFIPVGSSFDAYVEIGKVLGVATADALIVDPYMDEKALSEYALLTPEGPSVRLLTDAAGVKPTLAPAAKRWAEQHGGKRPLQVRLTAPHILHDRLIVIDGKTVSLLTQSLKDFAARSPASIVRVDQETAALKTAAYEELWRNAKPLGS